MAPIGDSPAPTGCAVPDPDSLMRYIVRYKYRSTPEQQSGLPIIHGNLNIDHFPDAQSNLLFGETQHNH